MSSRLMKVAVEWDVSYFRSSSQMAEAYSGLSTGGVGLVGPVSDKSPATELVVAK
jgi:hypothetical protein